MREGASKSKSKEIRRNRFREKIEAIEKLTGNPGKGPEKKSEAKWKAPQKATKRGSGSTTSPSSQISI